MIRGNLVTVVGLGTVIFFVGLSAYLIVKGKNKQQVTTVDPGSSGSSAAPSASHRASTPASESCLEFNIANILFKPRSVAVKYFGKIRKVLPPTNPGEDWEYDYSGGNSTFGTKNRTLGLQYTFRRPPKDYSEALCRVGLSADGPPSPLFPTFVWGAHVADGGVVRFQDTALDQVIVSKDLTHVAVYGDKAYAAIAAADTKQTGPPPPTSFDELFARMTPLCNVLQQYYTKAGLEVTVQPGISGGGKLGIIIDCTKELRPRVACSNLYNTFPVRRTAKLLEGAGVRNLIFRYDDGWLSKGEFVEQVP